MKVVTGTVQMIERNGNFNGDELKRLCSDDRGKWRFPSLLDPEGSANASHQPCTVVSIIGPQHSGKSYLMNHLFDTNFKVSEAELCYEQTTVGIWTARCICRSMIIMDVEGSDSGDRALEGTSFENTIALFALATSDAMLLNIKVQDFGKYNAGCRPLLNIIFQERAKLTQRKTRLIIVFRDCKKPDEVKENPEKVKSILKEIWLTVHPDDHMSPKFDDYIEVLVEAFPSYENMEYFDQKCSEMRKMLSSCLYEGSYHTASGFALVAEQIWEGVQNNRALDIPSLQDLQAFHLCGVIIEEIRSSLNKDIQELTDMGDSTSLDTFKARLNALLNSISTRFEQVTNVHVKDIMPKKKEVMITEILMTLQAKFQSIVLNNSNDLMEDFKSLIYFNLLHRVPHADIVADCLKRFDRIHEGFPTEYEKNIWDRRCDLENRVSDCIKQEDTKWFMQDVRHAVSKTVATIASPFVDPDRLYFDVSSAFGAPCADFWRGIRKARA